MPRHFMLPGADRLDNHLLDEPAESAVPRTIEIDDIGAPSCDPGTKVLLANGFAANGGPVDGSDGDLMNGRRVMQRCGDQNPEWLDVLQAGLDCGTVSLFEAERLLNDTTQRLREHEERRRFIKRLCAPCPTKDDRLSRARTGLRRLQKVPSDDERALIAAAVDSDLAELGARSPHRVNLIAYALKASPRTAYNLLNVGRALVAAALRASVLSPVVEKSGSHKARGTVRPNLRAACKRSLFDSRARIEALSGLSPRDQALVAREIERKITLADQEAREGLDAKAGLQKLSHSALDDLDAVDRNDAITRRQLGKRSAAERHRIIGEWLSDKLDDLTGIDSPLCKATVTEYAEALKKFAKAHRTAEKGGKKCANRDHSLGLANLAEQFS